MLSNLINTGDFTELLRELRRQGLPQILHRLHLSKRKSTEATWNRTDIPPKAFDAIEAVQSHIALAATGSPDGNIVDYISRKYLRTRGSLKALSIGAGHGRIEMEWYKAATYSSFVGIDVAPEAVRQANHAARSAGMSQLSFRVADANRDTLGSELYDVVFAWHALPPIAPMHDAVKRIYRARKPDGLLILYEYVGPCRFQWGEMQLREANQLLQRIPRRLRRRYGLESYKTRACRPGLLRMRIADPSEAVESDRIIPEVERMFTVIEKRELPGTLLQLVFNDIAHNFGAGDAEAEAAVRMCVEREQGFCRGREFGGDFVLGVFGKS